MRIKIKRSNKGISLIVLSITILVMAILAATAIIALEDSGIIGRSKNTASKQNYIQEYERLQVIKNGLLTDNLGKITIDEYITELTNKGLVESGVTTNPDGSKSVTTKTGFIANIIQDGESNLIISLGTSNATITLSPTTLTGNITSGEITKVITATTKDIMGDITWMSSNPGVAAVIGNNSSATVTMKNIGTATITATYGNAKASCTVTVTGTVATPTITLDKTTISKTIDSGSTATETITATTANISGNIIWKSSNTSVATVSASGNTAIVTMKAGGTATITASYGSTSASCTVVVTENEVYTNFLSGIWKFNEELVFTESMFENEYYEIDISYTSNNVRYEQFDIETAEPDGRYIYYINNSTHLEDLVYANDINGWELERYRIIDFGTTPQGVPEEFYNWLVANSVEGITPTITLNKTTISKTINVYGSATETITATTQDVYGTLVWTSSNTNVATVTANGNTAEITMIAGGTAIITVSCGNVSASCTVTVTERTEPLSGVWKFNSTLSIVNAYDFYTYVNFTSNGKEYTAISFEESGVPDGYPYELCYNVEAAVDYEYVYVLESDGTDGWESEAYRTVDFGSEEQQVPYEFYDWFIANATQVN